MKKGRKAAEPGRPQGSGDLRGGKENPAQNHDRGHDPFRPDSYPLQPGDRGRRDETHRRPHGGGGHHLGGSGIDHLPGDLPHTEEEGDGIE